MARRVCNGSLACVPVKLRAFTLNCVLSVVNALSMAVGSWLLAVGFAVVFSMRMMKI